MKYLTLVMWINTGLATIVVSLAFTGKETFDALYFGTGVVYI